MSADVVAESDAAGWGESKRPRNIVAGTYGRPVHPVLVVVPVGAWFASLVFDVGSRVGGPPAALSVGANWLMALGIVGAVGAAGTGFIDLQQVPAGCSVMRMGIVHMGLNLTATTLYVSNVVMRLEGRRERATIGQIALSAGSFALLAVGSHLGGLLAYRYGVRVVNERTQLEGYVVAADASA